MTSVFAKGPGLTTQENTVLIHYGQNQSKAVEMQAFYFLNIPAYLSLLISSKE